jgi:predicted nucleic acid-binding Zn ribbon protein
LKAIEICREYRRIAPRLLPGESLLFTDARSYESGTLTLTAANSAWADQIQRNKHRITSAMNNRFGNGIVKKVNIRIATKTEDEAWAH